MDYRVKIYRKLLVSRKGPENRCYAESGELLTFAVSHDKIKRKLPADEHLFVSLKTRQGARYGWIEMIERPMTAEEFRAADITSQSAVLGEANAAPLELYESFLESINRHDTGTAMATDWLDVVTMDAGKQRKLQFHKVLLRSKG